MSPPVSFLGYVNDFYLNVVVDTLAKRQEWMRRAGNSTYTMINTIRINVNETVKTM